MQYRFPFRIFVIKPCQRQSRIYFRSSSFILSCWRGSENGYFSNKQESQYLKCSWMKVIVLENYWLSLVDLCVTLISFTERKYSTKNSCLVLSAIHSFVKEYTFWKHLQFKSSSTSKISNYCNNPKTRSTAMHNYESIFQGLTVWNQIIYKDVENHHRLSEGLIPGLNGVRFFIGIGYSIKLTLTNALSCCNALPARKALAGVI